MVPNSLRQVDNHQSSQCQYDHNLLIEVAEGTKANAEAIKTLITLYRESFRWLLIVVCVIALGNKAVDLARDLWGPHQVQAEDK
jgi:hypothetical protein